MEDEMAGWHPLHDGHEFEQALAVGDTIQPSRPLSSLSSYCFQSFLASESFQLSQLSTSDGQSIGVSASASVLPMNIQD